MNVPEQLYLPHLNPAYDAAKSSKRRSDKGTNLADVDKLLSKSDRDKVISNSRDLERNQVDAAWIINLHLSRTATFHFQCRSGDDKLDQDIEEYIRWYSRPLNCDVAGRFSLPEIFQILERRAIVDGDAWLFKIDDGRVQLIDSDRVRTPTFYDTEDGKKVPSGIKDNLIHGVLPTSFGGTKAITVCDRGTTINSFKFNSLIPAGYLYQHGYFNFAGKSQLRGTSPLLAALNDFRDLYENKIYALAKQKLAAMFGVVIGRQDGAEELDGDDNETSLDLNDDGPFVFDGRDGDKLEVVESNVPGNNFESFHNLVLKSAIKCLNVPITIYDSSQSNFSSSRLDLQVWESIIKPKRENLKRIADQLTVWRLKMAIEDGDIDIGSRAIHELKWDWIPEPLPVIDRNKESKAEAQEIQNGTTNVPIECRRKGLDFRDVAMKQVEYEALLKKLRKDKGLLIDNEE